MTGRSTLVYSADSVLLTRIHRGENRIARNLEEISPNVLNALIATEDKRFYEHSGIDGKAIPAILYRYLARDQVSGASTISMQLARNLIPGIGREKTVMRKLKEMWVAVQLEKTYTKEEILSHYLNTVNIYGNCYGIETASRRLFGTSADSLPAEDAALIVGLLKGQGIYSPFRHPEHARSRRNLVLRLMTEKGKVSPNDLESLQKRRLLPDPNEKITANGLAPYFQEQVRLWLEKWGKANGFDPYRDGLRVYTTLDSRIQQHAEAAMKTHMEELQKTFSRQIRGKEPWRKDHDMLRGMMKASPRYLQGLNRGKTPEEVRQEFEQPVNMKIFTWEGLMDTVMSPMDSIRHTSRVLETGLVSIHPQSGHIKAWVGGIDYNHFKYDHVQVSKRQTGSTFKPFVFTAALDNGMHPCDEELNQRVFFYNEKNEVVWAPENPSSNAGGYVTLQQALRSSLNIITARLTKRIGIQNISEYARLMGIQTEIPPHPAACLGTTELNLLELTGAYGTFVNLGIWQEPLFITRIEDRNGRVLEVFTGRTRRAISDETAIQMVDMLRFAVGTRYNQGARHALPIQVGGKTGTTQNHSDGWFVGITPELVTGIWVGCAERRMRFPNFKYGQGSYMARPMFSAYMKRVCKDPETKPQMRKFERPAGVAPTGYCGAARRKSTQKSGSKTKGPQGFEGWE
ncbi:MAG: transglycosylase domain-containing protein [Bacteroidota bacterium]